MTNILSSPVIHGIEQRAADVVKKCQSAIGNHLDVYVSVIVITAKAMEK